MTSQYMQIAASVALSAIGLLFIALPELGHRLIPIETVEERNFAVRLLGAGLLCAVFLAWSIKDFMKT